MAGKNMCQRRTAHLMFSRKERDREGGADGREVMSFLQFCSKLHLQKGENPPLKDFYYLSEVPS